MKINIQLDNILHSKLSFSLIFGCDRIGSVSTWPFLLLHLHFPQRQQQGSQYQATRKVIQWRSEKLVGYILKRNWSELHQILTRSRSWALLEEPPIVQPLKNFPVFYGTPRFNAVFTRALHWSLSWATSIQSTPSHSVDYEVVCNMDYERFSNFKSNCKERALPHRVSRTTKLPWHLYWGWS
jgi:hypothetical protein